jgi:hypothetical protein
LREAKVVQEYGIEPWRDGLDATAFSCGMASIDQYIKGDRAHRAMSSFSARVFVLLASQSNVIRGYYTLSALGIFLDDLPQKIKKNLPRYPQVGATLLGRLGVDLAYEAQLREELGENPRLGEYLFIDAQRRALDGAQNQVGLAMMIIDVLRPSAEDAERGVSDPMQFYLNYGFAPFPGNERRLFKPMRTIADEYSEA